MVNLIKASHTLAKYCGCGGEYQWRHLPYGGMSLRCSYCGHVLYPRMERKGGSKMPFDKNARKADDVAEDIRGLPLDRVLDVPIQINSFTVEDTAKYGNLAHIEGQSEDGSPLKLYTFSAVVIEQLQQLEKFFPVVVTVTKPGEYFQLF